MSFFGDILPYLGFNHRFFTPDGDCLATKLDAVELLAEGMPLALCEVFELSWFGWYRFFWVNEVGLFVTGLTEMRLGKQPDHSDL